MVSFVLVLVLVLVALQVEVEVVVVVVVVGMEDDEEEIAARLVLADRAVSLPVGSAIVLAATVVVVVAVVRVADDILYAPTQSATSSSCYCLFVYPEWMIEISD